MVIYTWDFLSMLQSCTYLVESISEVGIKAYIQCSVFTIAHVDFFSVIAQVMSKSFTRFIVHMQKLNKQKKSILTEF